MYWLGTSRWGCSPLCTLHSICVCFFLAFTPFLLLFRCLVLLCVLACVYPLWHGGFLGSCFLPFIPYWARYCPDESHCLDSLLGLHLVVVGLLAINLPIASLCLPLPYLAFTSHYSRGLTGWCSCRISPLIH